MTHHLFTAKIHDIHDDENRLTHYHIEISVYPNKMDQEPLRAGEFPEVVMAYRIPCLTADELVGCCKVIRGRGTNHNRWSIDFIKFKMEIEFLDEALLKNYKILPDQFVNPLKSLTHDMVRTLIEQQIRVVTLKLENSEWDLI